MELFDVYGREKSAIFQYWSECLRAIGILLECMRSDRDGNWSDHISSQKSMIPYFFVCNHTNYARWTPVNILSMNNLPDTVQSSFEKFNGTPGDMATEKTVIKDTKSKSGLLGITQQKLAVLRWSLSRHVVGEYSSAMQEFSSKARTYNDKSQYQNHRDCQPACMRRHENHVCLIVDNIYSNMTNPFDVTVHPQLFVKISNGLTASCEVQHFLLNIVPT